MPQKMNSLGNGYKPLLALYLNPGELFKISNRRNNKTHYEVIEVGNFNVVAKSVTTGNERSVKVTKEIYVTELTYAENLFKKLNQK